METFDFKAPERAEASTQSNLSAALMEQPSESMKASFASQSSGKVQDYGFPTIQLTDSNPQSFQQLAQTEFASSPYGGARTSRPTDSQSRQPGDVYGQPRTSGPTGKNSPFELPSQTVPPRPEQQLPADQQRQQRQDQRSQPESPYGPARTSRSTESQSRHPGENPGNPRTSRPTGKNSPFEQRPEQKPEQKPAPVEPRTRPDAHPARRPEQRPEHRPEQKPEQKPEQRNQKPGDKAGPGEKQVDVKPGETLWGIAKKALLEGHPNDKPSPRDILKMVDEIARRNGIQNPNKIHPGQKFIIPKHR